MLPAPQCVVFYNGKSAMPEEQTLKLSDAFGDKRHKADVEKYERTLKSEGFEEGIEQGIRYNIPSRKMVIQKSKSRIR